jgi:hypothetical protein
MRQIMFDMPNMSGNMQNNMQKDMKSMSSNIYFKMQTCTKYARNMQENMHKHMQNDLDKSAAVKFNA